MLSALNEGGRKIAYGDYSWPTFFIDYSQLNILQASCRKAHGAGKDAMPAIDKLLRNTYSNLAERPSALFLTGDQIYADDVHPELIQIAHRVGAERLGFKEKLEGSPWLLEALTIDMRRQLAPKMFTPDTDSRGNAKAVPLFGFGELVGLYLLSWSEILWTQMPADPSLQAFRAAASVIRRTLANIPTYMAADDHEVADDWNISQAWTERVRRSPQGRWVVTNALLAYWLFQGWGNQPTSFDSNFVGAARAWVSGGSTGGGTLDKLVLDEPSSRWSYIAPTSPPVFVLDSRLRRTPSAIRKTATKSDLRATPEATVAPSAVLDDDAIAEFLKSAQQADLTGGLVVVAQSPIISNPDAQAHQERLVTDLSKSIEFADLDMFRANRSGYYKILAALFDIGPRAGLILSGDVHYSFVARATITRDSKSVLYAQFTSSSLKNEHMGVARGALESSSSLNPRSVDETGWAKAPRYVNAPPRIAEYLSVSPTVLSDVEQLTVNLALNRTDKPTLNIAYGTIRPTAPPDGPCTHVRTNFGQVVLSKSGRAILRLYDASAEQFAQYDIDLTKA